MNGSRRHSLACFAVMGLTLILLGCASEMELSDFVQDAGSGLGAGVWAAHDNASSEQPYFEIRVRGMATTEGKWLVVARVRGDKPSVQWDPGGAAAFELKQYGETHRILRLEYDELSALECPSTKVMIDVGNKRWGVHLNVCAR